MTSRVTLNGQGRDPNMLGPSISETAGDRDLMTMECQEMDTWESNMVT